MNEPTQTNIKVPAAILAMMDAAKKPDRVPQFSCQECGRAFYTIGAAERASNDGCPQCGSVDVDVYDLPFCEIETDPVDAPASRPTILDQAKGRLGGRDVQFTLTHHTCGYRQARSGVRWLGQDVWSVTNDSGDVIHGFSFGTESEARAYFRTHTVESEIHVRDATGRQLHPRESQRDVLIAEWLRYREGPHPDDVWPLPTARQEAGYCLQFPAPIQIMVNLVSFRYASSEYPAGHFDRVRALILREGGAV